MSSMTQTNITDVPVNVALVNCPIIRSLDGLPSVACVDHKTSQNVDDASEVGASGKAKVYPDVKFLDFQFTANPCNFRTMSPDLHLFSLLTPVITRNSIIVDVNVSTGLVEPADPADPDDPAKFPPVRYFMHDNANNESVS